MHTIRRSGEYVNTIVDVTNSNSTTMLGVIHEISGATPSVFPLDLMFLHFI